MATKSFLKNVHIEGEERAERLVAAMEAAESASREKAKEEPCKKAVDEGCCEREE